MGHEIYAKYAVEYALAQVGNVCGKSSKYAQEMDSIGFYNYPKNGAANSCKIFVDNCYYHATRNPELDKYRTLEAVNEPQSKGANEGAGCVQAIGYFKKAGRWIESTSDMERGDEIFFGKPEYVSSANPLGVYHTGIIVDWGSSFGFRTVEGNTNGGYVGDHTYSFGDYRIIGAGRPDFDGWEPTEASDPEPEKTPEPEVEPEQKSLKLKVITESSPLMLRAEPYTTAQILDEIPKGTILTELDVCNGSWVHGDNSWFLVNFNGIKAWCAGYYLLRV